MSVRQSNLMLRAEMKDYFFDRALILKLLEPVMQERLARAGDYVMNKARWSIRRHRRWKRKTLAMMTPEEKEKAEYILRKFGKKWRPVKAGVYRKGAPAGKPPLSTTRTLPHSIFFAYSVSQGGTVVGPVDQEPHAVESLEKGGRTRITAGPNKGTTITLRPRPFMVPALEKSQTHISRLFKDLL